MDLATNGSTRSGRHQASIVVWLLPGLAVLIALFVVPFSLIYIKSVTDPTLGLQNYKSIFTNPLYIRVLRNTVVSALWATVGCLLIGYPLAYAIYSSSNRMRVILLGSVLFAYSVGTIPRAIAWLVVLGDKGLVNDAWAFISRSRQPLYLIYNQFGVVVGMTHIMLPFMTLLLLGAMMRVSPHLVPAARTLGASPVRAFLEVFLPQTRPGIIAAVMLIFVYSLGFYVIPAVLGGPTQTTVVMQIQSLIMNGGQWGLGSALSGILAISSIIGAIVYVRATGLTDVYTRD